MGTMPNPNLPNEATPWGKWVIGQIESLLDSAGRRNLNATNSGKAQNATTEALGEQIQTLQQTIVTLEETIADVSALALNQVTPAVGSSGASSFALGTSQSIVASMTFTVPAGYTRAIVSVSGAINSASSSTTGDTLFAACGIAGVSGSEMAVTLPQPSPYGGTACFTSRVLTGLFGGGTFTADVRGRLATGGGIAAINYAQVSAQVIYLK